MSDSMKPACLFTIIKEGPTNELRLCIEKYF